MPANARDRARPVTFDVQTRRVPAVASITLGPVKQTKPDRPRWRVKEEKESRSLGMLLHPTVTRAFWRALRLVMKGHSPYGGPSQLSRITNSVILLDPISYYTWPHPRIEPVAAERCLGTVAAHWILRLRSSRLEARLHPVLGLLDEEEAFAAFQKDLEWRNQMFSSYGDKSPPGVTKRPRGPTLCVRRAGHLSNDKQQGANRRRLHAVVSCLHLVSSGSVGSPRLTIVRQGSIPRNIPK